MNDDVSKAAEAFDRRMTREIFNPPCEACGMEECEGCEEENQ